MKKIILLFVSITLVFIKVEGNEPVKLSVYYESLCPDSISFVKYQLYPTWVSLTSQYLAIDFVPYGKATQTRNSNGTWVFTCQHGRNECQGNKVQACALSELSENATAQVKFISCVMSNRNPPKAGQQCGSLLGIDYAPIQSCAEGEDGNLLLAAMGNRTHSFRPRIRFVPTVAYDGVYSQSDQDESLTNLKAVVCQHLEDPKPEACNS